MFKNIFKKSQEPEEDIIYAPLNGEIAPLEDVPDPVFSERMMGDGLAIIPKDGKLVSPVKGEVVHLPDTKHAAGLKTDSGLEILVHIGLETVALKGEGFTAKVAQGDSVNPGDVLIEFDLDYIKENADAIITPIIWTNGQDSEKKLKKTDEKNATAGETVLMEIG